MLKNNGKNRPMKKIKCSSCGKRVDICLEDIEEVAGSKVTICPNCEEDIVIKK